MEQGSLRCDVNVSVCKPDSAYGTRCEIKNVNSIRFVQQAIEYDSQRQVEILENGGVIDQETRLFDSNQGITRTMRSKEEAHDYRYFPDPDLLPLVLTEKYVEDIKASLPELPDAKKNRFQNDLGLTPYHAGVLVSDQENADYFEILVEEITKKLKGISDGLAQDCANVMVTDLFGHLNKDDLSICDSPISPSGLAELQALKIDGTISGRIAKDVFEEMFATGKSAATIVEDRGLRQLSDSGELEALIVDVLNTNPKQVEQYRAGKEALFVFFVGQAMKLTNGQANPAMVNKILKEK